MSVVVRMDMPKGCWDCPCVNGEYGYCQADKEERQIEDPNERPSWCPILCQLHEGHGRLIDADALNLDHKVEMAVEMAVDWKTAHMISNVVKYAPTIVPAERSET